MTTQMRGLTPEQSQEWLKVRADRKANNDQHRVLIGAAQVYRYNSHTYCAGCDEKVCPGDTVRRIAGARVGSMAHTGGKQWSCCDACADRAARQVYWINLDAEMGFDWNEATQADFAAQDAARASRREARRAALAARS